MSRSAEYGPFASAAHELAEHCLAPIPLGGEDGKRPMITGFSRWKRPPRTSTLDVWATKFPDANIGIVTGVASKVTVLDIDDPTQRDEIEAAFGSSPLVAKTPGGGFHLYFRYSGERCRNLRPEYSADLKAAGGQVVAPPSVRDGRAPYRFVEGHLALVQQLPTLQSSSFSASSPGYGNEPHARKGARNDTLYLHLMAQAPSCDTFDDLLDVARTANDNMLPLMKDREVINTALSAWRYEQSGRNYIGYASLRGKHCEWTRNLDDSEYRLYQYLRDHNFGDNKIFPIANALCASLRWSLYKLRKARRGLVHKGVVECIYEGGNGPGDPPLFRWGPAILTM